MPPSTIISSPPYVSLPTSLPGACSVLDRDPHTFRSARDVLAGAGTRLKKAICASVILVGSPSHRSEGICNGHRRGRLGMWSGSLRRTNRFFTQLLVRHVLGSRTFFPRRAARGECVHPAAASATCSPPSAQPSCPAVCTVRPELICVVWLVSVCSGWLQAELVL
jgi:hypothetical protein